MESNETVSVFPAVVETTSYGFLFALAISGNLLVSCALLRRGQLDTPSNRLVFSLTSSHCVLLLLLLPTVFGSIWKQKTFDEAWCNVTAFSTVLVLVAGSWTLASISMDRFIAIVYPMKYGTVVTGIRVTAILMGVWIVGSGCAIAPVVGFSRYEYREGMHTCWIQWSANYIYDAALLITSVLIPLLTMLAAYIRILRIVKMKCRKIIVGALATPPKTILSERKFSSADETFRPSLVAELVAQPLGLTIRDCITAKEQKAKDIQGHPPLSRCRKTSDRILQPVDRFWQSREDERSTKFLDQVIAELPPDPMELQCHSSDLTLNLAEQIEGRLEHLKYLKVVNCSNCGTSCCCNDSLLRTEKPLEGKYSSRCTRLKEPETPGEFPESFATEISYCSNLQSENSRELFDETNPSESSNSPTYFTERSLHVDYNSKKESPPLNPGSDMNVNVPLQFVGLNGRGRVAPSIRALNCEEGTIDTSDRSRPSVGKFSHIRHKLSLTSARKASWGTVVTHISPTKGIWTIFFVFGGFLLTWVTLIVIAVWEVASSTMNSAEKVPYFVESISMATIIAGSATHPVLYGLYDRSIRKHLKMLFCVRRRIRRQSLRRGSAKWSDTSDCTFSLHSRDGSGFGWSKKTTSLSSVPSTNTGWNGTPRESSSLVVRKPSQDSGAVLPSDTEDHSDSAEGKPKVFRKYKRRMSAPPELILQNRHREQTHQSLLSESIPECSPKHECSPISPTVPYSPRPRPYSPSRSFLTASPRDELVKYHSLESVYLHPCERPGRLDDEGIENDSTFL